MHCNTTPFVELPSLRCLDARESGERGAVEEPPLVQVQKDRSPSEEKSCPLW